jgi:hypothetical protein
MIGFYLTFTQDRAFSNRQTPVSRTKNTDRENRAIQTNPMATPGTPSRLRQPSPLKELWARSQAAAAGQCSPTQAMQSPSSPLKMHLFGISPTIHYSSIGSFIKVAFLFGFVLHAQSVYIVYAGSQLPQSRLPMPKSWTLPSSAPACVSQKYVGH